jgi:hypothetical protein
MHTLEAFRWRLAETIAWCAPRVAVDNPSKCLRSPELRSCVFDYDTRYEFNSGEARQSEVERVAAERAQALRILHTYPSMPAHDLAGGALLLFAPDGMMYECYCSVVSDGFLDEADAPPWDTWLYLIQNEQTVSPREQQRDPGWHPGYDQYLVSWVPAPFMHLLEAGIQGSSTYCLELMRSRWDPFLFLAGPATKPYPPPPSPVTPLVRMLSDAGLLQL